MFQEFKIIIIGPNRQNPIVTGNLSELRIQLAANLVCVLLWLSVLLEKQWFVGHGDRFGPYPFSWTKPLDLDIRRLAVPPNRQVGAFVARWLENNVKIKASKQQRERQFCVEISQFVFSRCASEAFEFESRAVDMGEALKDSGGVGAACTGVRQVDDPL